MVFDSDDFGCNHVISDQCQSHDCRDMLDRFHIANPNFKATLFTIPGEMTIELIEWCAINKEWIELAWHGFYHRDNYECEKMTYDEFDKKMKGFDTLFGQFFANGFKAPGWQISNDIYEWLHDHDYWVADQAYNDDRRPSELRAYVNNNGQFSANGVQFNGAHYHTWDCVGNGVYERCDEIIELIGKDKKFRFVSEAINEAYSNEK